MTTWLVTVGTAVSLCDAPDAYQARWRVTRRLGVPIDGATAREATSDEVARFRWAEKLTTASRSDRISYLRRET